jgi:hypothetical protein
LIFRQQEVEREIKVWRRGPADRRVVTQNERFLQEGDRLAIGLAGFSVRHRFPQAGLPEISA